MKKHLNLAKLGKPISYVFIALMIIPLLSFVTTPQATVLAKSPDKSPKFDVTFEIDDRYMTRKTLYITVTNLQDSSDFITMKTILSSTDFLIFDVRDVEFAIEQLETYQVSVSDYGDVLYEDIPIYDSENILVGYEDEWRREAIGSHLEDRERLVWNTKVLVNETEDGLKGELKNQWEEIPIQKAGQQKDTLRFRFRFNHPIVKGMGGWGSRGIISLDLNGEVFVDLTNSSWWDTDWGYRKKITLSNDHPAGYQIRLSLDISAELGGKAESDFSDIRFLENEDNEELDYWIESITGDNAVIWVERSDNDSTDRDIYVYYGGTASAVENGEDTFLFFDEFDDGIEGDKWTEVSDGAYFAQGAGLLRASGTPSAADAYLHSDTAFSVGPSDGVVFEFDILVTNDHYYAAGFTDDGAPAALDDRTVQLRVGGTIQWSTGSVDTTKDFNVGEWENWGFVARDNDTGFDNDRLDLDWSDNSTLAGTYTPMRVMFSLVGIAGGDISFDNVIVRRFSELAPTASVGVEETVTVGISSISVDESVIDVDVDDASSEAVASTQITVRVRGYENRDNIDLVYIWIRDNEDSVVVDNILLTDNVAVDNYMINFTYTYNPADNLPVDNLGAFDVRVVAFHNLGDNDTEDYTGKGYQLFTVDDATSSITFGTTNPYYWWEENAVGTVTRKSGATASAENVWYTDAVEGTWYLGSGNNWATDNYTINSLPGENVTVTVTIWDPPLDGLVTSSYVVHENWQFQLNLLWEDNFEYVGDNTVENVKNWWVEFWFADYETQEVQLTATSNLVITAYESDTLRVTDRDENYYRTYRTNRENIDVFMVADNSLPLLTAYLLSLDDPSTRWGPLNDGAIMIYKLIENEVAYINDSYWMATSDVSLYMIRPDVYNVRLEAPGLTTLDYGRLDADLNTSKIISPGLGLAEYGVETINIHYMVTVSYWTTVDNHLMIFYQDNYENTNWIRFIIRNVDGDVLWETFVEDVNEYTAEFTEIDIDNIYDIGIRFDHDTYGAVRRSFVYIPYYYSESVVPPVPSSSPGGLDILGDPPVPWGYLITFTILMLVLVSFGPGHSGIAVLATAMMSVLLNLTEIIVIGWELIFFLIVIGILTQIFEARKGGRLA